MTRRAAVQHVLVGALVGLAWAAALRAYMVEIAGPGSRVEWLGTFAVILLPGVLVGALLGWAEVLRRSGGRRGWRWVAAAPLLFAIAGLLPPGALETFLTTGVGGGALAVPLEGMIGGYAISGRGPLWARIVSGVIAGGFLVTGVLAAPLLRPALDLTTPRGVWVALLFATLIVLLALAASIPHRRVAAAQARP
jgi:hypothetical protein